MDWQSILRIWTLQFEDMAGAGVNRVTEFADVPVPKRSPYGFVATFDFWARALFPSRFAEIREYSDVPTYWQSQRGTQNTAALLWHFRGDAEMLALVLVAGWLHDNGKYYDRWPGKAFRRLEEAVRDELVRRKVAGVVNWHHASRETLPSRPPALHALHYANDDTRAVLEEWDLLTLAAEAAVLSVGTRVVVRIGNPDNLKRNDERDDEVYVPTNVISISPPGRGNRH